MLLSSSCVLLVNRAMLGFTSTMILGILLTTWAEPVTTWAEPVQIVLVLLFTSGVSEASKRYWCNTKIDF